MVKKRIYWKNIFKSITQSPSRFFSIFTIVFLGAAFYAGLRNTPQTMENSIDHFLNNQQYAQLTYLSSLGFSENDIALLDDIDGIEDYTYGYQFDAQLKQGEQLKGVTVYTNNDYREDMVNAPDLREGRYPTSHDECIIDEKMALEGLSVDDTIQLTNKNGTKSYKIVGIVNDVRYISSVDRGVNSLGDGTNSGFVQILTSKNEFMALPDELYTLRGEDVLYNQISVRVEGTEDYYIFSDESDEYIEIFNSRIKSALSLQLSLIYEDIVSDAQGELNDAKELYESEFKKFTDGKTEFEKQILEAKLKIIDAKMQLVESQTQIVTAQEGISDEVKEAASQLQVTTDKLQQSLKEYREAMEDYNNDPSIGLPSDEKIQEQLSELNSMMSGLNMLATGLSQMASANSQIEAARLEIERQENALTLTELTTREQLAKGESELAIAKEEIDKAQAEINSIPKGALYTLTRHENAGLVNFEANKMSIASIATVFPLMFFLVSALVSLTTMTRMVEEQRGQSGTLRALGYTKQDIIVQYIVYVILATLIASVLGMIIGTQVFPRIIYYLYNLMLFEVNAPVQISSGLAIAIQTLFISVFVTLLATLSVCISELNLMPAVLMRPKAPKLGKRIVLEKFPSLWKRLSFQQKVTIRNMFRYKKRFLMSIIGIAGCTALIITGFGIKYSVSEVVNRQYGRVFDFDAQIRLEDEITTKDAKLYETNLLNRSEVTHVEYLNTQSVQLEKDKESLYGSMVVYQSAENMKNFINFYDFYTGKELYLQDEGVVLTAKTSELLGVGEGDQIDVVYNGTRYGVKVSHVMENYFMNTIYMSQTLYENLFGEKTTINGAMMNMSSVDDSSKVSLETYMREKNYGNISYIGAESDAFLEQMQSIDIVVIILILCAGALNFIVLYNLTNINIQERKSEIATIKVLGFRKKEVYNYIFRENILLSIIGGLVGTFFGYLLHMFIVRTVELDLTMFVREIAFSSYVIAIAITMGFTFLINYVMRRVLNKVDMVESLKSVE